MSPEMDHHDQEQFPLTFMIQWYYGTQGQQQGPVTETELRQLMAQGVVTRETLVWRDGLAEWKPMGDVAELLAPPLGAAAAMAYTQQAAYGVVPQCGLAIASMVCGIVSLLTCYVHGLAAIPAIICGHMAMKKIRESEVPMAGRGMAIAGLVTGYLGLLMQIGTLVAVGYFFLEVKKSFPSPP
jgi:hypothetical protein